MMSAFLQSLTLSEKVVVGTALLGGMSGVVGSFAVLRGRSLVGDMLAHAALPGVCLAFLLIGSRNLLGLSIGALVAGLAAIGAVTMIVRWTRTKEDAAIGIVLSTFFGAGVVLLSVIQKPSVGGNKAGLDAYLFGEPGNMLSSDLMLLGATAIVVVLTVGLLFKEFELVCFDKNFAQSQGWPTLWLDLVMMASLAIVTVVGLPVMGVILMAAMIIFPAATARLWTDRLPFMLLLAGGFGIAAGTVGTTLGRGLPAGAVIVLTAAVLFLLSLLLAPERGLLVRAIAEFRLRKRIEREHLLRSLYELNEQQLPEVVALRLEKLQAYRHWNNLERRLREAIDAELITRAGRDVKMTAVGFRRAAQLTKTHRLWELYLMQHAGIAPDHVDRDADDVEHLLPESLLVELQHQLELEGRLPREVSDVPDSPHELGSPE